MCPWPISCAHLAIGAHLLITMENSRLVADDINYPYFRDVGVLFYPEMLGESSHAVLHYKFEYLVKLLLSFRVRNGNSISMNQEKKTAN